MEWIFENKTWLFSGIAIAIPLAAIGWLTSNRKTKQSQKSGKKSVNIQVGGNLKIGKDKNDE